MDGEREKFEAWAEENDFDISPHDYPLDGVPVYREDITEAAYEAWQARASLPSAQPSDVVEEMPPQEELTLVALWWRAEDDTYKVAKPRFNAFSTDADALYVDVTEDSNHTTRYLARQQAALTTQQAQSGDVGKLVEAAEMAETEMRYAGFAKLEEDNVGKKPAYFALVQALQPFTQNKGD